MPLRISGSVAVTSPSGGGLILIGGAYHNFTKMNQLIEFKGSTMEWIILEQKLQYARSKHVAFYIPDELTHCREQGTYTKLSNHTEAIRKIVHRPQISEVI